MPTEIGASPRGIVVDTRNSPHARLRPVAVGAVKLLPGFWHDRISVNARVTVEHVFEQLEIEGMFNRFKKAHDPAAFAGEVRFAGEARLYKWLEAAGTTMVREQPPEIAAMVESAIDVIERAQFENGYIGLTIPPDRPEKRWQDPDFKHELFAAGHLFQAAIAHRRATGSERLFEVARRLADHVAAEFGPGQNEGRPGHPEIEMALVEMYRETGEQRYLDTARFFVDAAGGAEMTAISGHAVKATFFAAGMADLYAETGEAPYREALERLWKNMVGSKMYITGAVGGRVRTESFGREFELPHENAYAETCAAIGSVMWNWRMLGLEGDGRFADLMELCIYNSVLAGVGLSGDSFFYDVPHACFGENAAGPWSEQDRHTTPGPRARQPWFFERVSCCPSNLARFLAQLPGYFYGTNEEGLWVHMYAANGLDWQLDDGMPVRLRVSTRYPWDGTVEMEVEPEHDRAFSLFLRIPGWCQQATASINGQAVTVAPHKGYLELRRRWSRGDSIVLDLPIRPEVLVADPRVVEARDSVALQRGPLVYCLEGVDNRGLALRDVELQVGASGDFLREVPHSGFAEDAVAITGEGSVPADPQSDLYRKMDAPQQRRKQVSLTAIPFFAWGNRGESEMTLWIRKQRESVDHG